MIVCHSSTHRKSACCASRVTTPNLLWNLGETIHFTLVMVGVIGT